MIEVTICGHRPQLAFPLSIINYHFFMSELYFSRLRRAQLLLQTDRVDEAVKELRGMISDAPDFGPAYGLLALCLADKDGAIEEADRLARRAVALDPENAFGHYTMSYVLFKQKEYEGADLAIRNAIELEQDDPDYHSFRGSMFLARNRREEAKRMFLEALAIDPDHHQSLTLLSQIESQLGNVEEARRIAAQAVQNSPEDADAHVARGYSFIYSHRPKEAFEAFREALRLEPNSEHARSGLLHALQMHHFFYRGMFTFFSFMNRLSSSMQWGLIIGLLVGYNILRSLARQHPEWAPLILPLIVLYLLFAFMSWITEPLTYFFLFFSRWGRLAMNWRQKLSGLVFATFLPLGILGILFAGNSDIVFLTGLTLLLTMIPLTHTLQADDLRRRSIFGLYTLGMAGMILAAFLAQNAAFISVAVLMLIGFQFLANYFSIRSTSPQ